MLKINSLLNPSPTEATRLTERMQCTNTPPTPASTMACSSNSASRSATPYSTSSTKQRKLVKGATVFKGHEIRGEINHAPYECSEDTICLSATDQDELVRQHKIFAVCPSGFNKEDLISGRWRHIPYSSEKKTFGCMTGKQGFDVFHYTFIVPNDPSHREHEVMWDYENGLVRITPFFKASNYSKTTPAKALNANPGLKDLSYSITGGALSAQGYWMPFNCARALCLTFCYPIRWALTPIFGPSFVRQCLKPGQPGYEKWKIGGEAIRNAQLEAEGWSMVRDGVKSEERSIPRSVPPEAVADEKSLRSRLAKPAFKSGSPFEFDLESDNTPITASSQSPGVSPKTSHDSPTWTSINKPRSSPSPSHKMPADQLSGSLLAQPHYGSWRPAEDHVIARHPEQSNDNISNSTRGQRRIQKRRRSPSNKIDSNTEHADIKSNIESSPSESESDDADIIISPPSAKKRARRLDEKVSSARFSPQSTSSGASNYRSKKYCAEDFRAAIYLMNLSRRDADLATGSNDRVDLRQATTN